jgi:CMP-N,N'-diacetyllegionaminic acid synthase
MILCIIPARGGSKGIPRKNVVSVCGKPLLAWSIEAALESIVDEVVVTTDDDEIAEVASDYGANVFRRSARTATDKATSESALLEVLRSRGDRADIEYIVFLQATSPCRIAKHIDLAIAAIRCERADSLFSAREIDGFTWTSGKLLTPNYTNRWRRQEKPVVRLEENGSIYVFKPFVLEQFGKRLGGVVTTFYMHALDSLQIDEPHDVPIMESVMQLRMTELNGCLC